MAEPIVFHRCPPCMVCGKTHTVELTLTEKDALDAGKFVQEALPTRSPEFREMLITGMCFCCQAKVFASLEFYETQEEAMEVWEFEMDEIPF